MNETPEHDEQRNAAADALNEAPIASAAESALAGSESAVVEPGAAASSVRSSPETPSPDAPTPAPVEKHSSMPPRPAPTLPPSPKTSGRMRLVPPDVKTKTWWERHSAQVNAAEWAAAVILTLVALYYLYLLLFGGAADPAIGLKPPSPPTREEFRARVRAMTPIKPDASWQAASPAGRWRQIVIHHSATDAGNADVFDKYHREVRKWTNGLGYHFVIGNGNGMEDGEVAVGRRWIEQIDGAHVRGPDKDNANSYSIGVALVGNFEDAMPSIKQLASLKGLLAFLRTTYGIGLASIVGHNAVAANSTACPGKYFFVDEVVLALANP